MTQQCPWHHGVCMAFIRLTNRRKISSKSRPLNKNGLNLGSNLVIIKTFEKLDTWVTPWCQWHHEDWLHRVNETSESDSESPSISAKSRPYTKKIHKHMNRGPGWVRIMGKTGVNKSRDTVPLRFIVLSHRSKI